MTSILGWIIGWLLHLKYFAMFGILVLCGLGLPIPEEATLVGSGLLVGCLFLAMAYARTGLAEIDVYPSRAVLRSSLTVLIVGGYLYPRYVFNPWAFRFGQGVGAVLRYAISDSSVLFAEVGFQPFDGLTDGGLRAVHLGGGAGKGPPKFLRQQPQPDRQGRHLNPSAVPSPRTRCLDDHPRPHPLHAQFGPQLAGRRHARSLGTQAQPRREGAQRRQRARRDRPQLKAPR